MRYKTRQELSAALKFSPDSKIIVTGIEQEHWVEPWWSLGRVRCKILLQEFRDLGIELVTPTNFSLFCDQPRPNDFSAMKRIGTVQSEFLAAGVPCALHPHVRTKMDSERWASYVSSRPEIETIAYEFTTGAGLIRVQQFHVDHLIRLAKEAGRPLDLVYRGDHRVLPKLIQHYRNVVYIDTNAFMKSVYRKIAVRTKNNSLIWKPVVTPDEMTLDSLLQSNVDEVTLLTQMLLAKAA